MATWYVATTGNDSTGNGTIGTPWASVNKATTLNASLARGDSVLIGDGTYAENTSSAGYWSVTRLPSGTAGFVLITPQNGLAGNVTITGTAGTGNYDVLLSANSQNYKFYNIKFRSADSAKVSVIRINAMTNVVFDICTVTVITNPGQINYGISGNPSSSVSGLTIIRSTVAMTGTDNARAISMVPSTQTVDSITISDSTITATGMCIQLSGVTNSLVTGNTINSTVAVNGGYGVYIGFDAATYALNSSGTVLNNNIFTAGGHSVIFGADTTTGRCSGNLIVGGDSSTAGHGLVVKNTHDVVVTGNWIYDGYNSGLYLKAALRCGVYYNAIYNQKSLASTSSCIRLGVNSENASKVSGNTIKYNKLLIQAIRAFYWEGTAGDDGTSVADYNEFYFTPGTTATWGTVTGTTTAGTAKSGLTASWAGSFASGEQANEANSDLWGGMLNLVIGAPTGKRLYALAFNKYGALFNGVAFETPLDFATYLGRYMIPFVEMIPASGIYQCLLPYGLVQGSYTVMVGQIAGNVAAMTDTQIPIALNNVDWSGSVPLTNAESHRQLSGKLSFLAAS